MIRTTLGGDVSAKGERLGAPFTGGGGEVAGVGTEGDPLEIGRGGTARGSISFGMGRFEEVEEERTRGFGADQIDTRPVVEVTEPHRSCVSFVESGSPGVAVTVAGSGLPMYPGGDAAKPSAFRKIGTVATSEGSCGEEGASWTEDGLREPEG
jgi:hypothetical protein